jgi:chromosome segregation ATPase
MKTKHNEIIERVLNQIEPNGELLNTEQCIKAMEAYSNIVNATIIRKVEQLQSEATVNLKTIEDLFKENSDWKKWSEAAKESIDERNETIEQLNAELKHYEACKKHNVEIAIKHNELFKENELLTAKLEEATVECQALKEKEIKGDRKIVELEHCKTVLSAKLEAFKKALENNK